MPRQAPADTPFRHFFLLRCYIDTAIEFIYAYAIFADFRASRASFDESYI